MDCLQYFRVTQSYNITGKTYRIDGVVWKKNYGPHRFSLHGEAPVTNTRLEQNEISRVRRCGNPHIMLIHGGGNPGGII